MKPTVPMHKKSWKTGAVSSCPFQPLGNNSLPIRCQTEKSNASDGDDDDRVKNGLTPGHADQDTCPGTRLHSHLLEKRALVHGTLVSGGMSGRNSGEERKLPASRRSSSVLDVLLLVSFYFGTTPCGPEP